MKVDKYVDDIILKLKYSGGYSELPIDRMAYIITKYLTEEHDQEVEKLAFRMESERLSGIQPNIAEYHKEYDALKQKVINKAMELALTEKP